MTKPLSDNARATLEAAQDTATSMIRAGGDAATVIAALVDFHGMKRSGWNPYVLSLAGVRASCTFDANDALLKAWLKNCSMRLILSAQDTAA